MSVSQVRGEIQLREASYACKGALFKLNAHGVIAVTIAS